MDSILLCTNNVIPKKLMEAVVKNAFDHLSALSDVNLVIVSQYPVFSDNIFVDMKDATPPDIKSHTRYDSIRVKEAFLDHLLDPKPAFPILNIVVGEKAYSVDTIYHQLLVGLDYCGDNVVVFEHDVLYPRDYVNRSFEAIKSGKDICFWDNAVYLSYQGFFRLPGSYMFNRFSFRKSFLIRHILDKKSRKKTSIEPSLKGVFSIHGEPEYDNFIVLDGIDIMDIKHGFNTGGYVMVENYQDIHSYWGSKDKYLDLIDIDYRNATQKNLSCFYGFGED